MLNRLSFGLDPGNPIPYSSQGEIVSRLRTIDGHTIAQPPSADAIATATAAKVAAGSADAISAALAKLGWTTPPTPQEVAAAVYAALVANPLSLH
jgi:hypothetical protein